MAPMAPTKLIPLKNAPWAFASQRLRTAWRRAQHAPGSPKASTPNPASTDAIRKLATEDPAEAVKQVAESITAVIDDLRIRSVPEEVMQGSLLEKLRDGSLEAWGVETAPDRKRDLEMLPPHFFLDARISWTRNIVASLGATYGAVQVRRRSSTIPAETTASAESSTSGGSLLTQSAHKTSGDTDLQSHTPSPLASKRIENGPLPSGARGRPSKTPEIEHSIDTLLEKGVALAKMPRPKAYAAVRKAADELKYNTEIGFSDPVIQRALGRRFGPRR
jgi:hypothetical protein